MFFFTCDKIDCDNINDTIHCMIVSTDQVHNVAVHIAPLVRPGCPLLLSGPLGSGKTTLTRHILRLYDPTLTHVPSPTFPIMIPYDCGPTGTVWHMDLYRLNGDDDVAQLDIPTLIAQHLCIIEWPERLGHHTPRTCIHCAIDFAPSNGSLPVLRGRTYTLVVHP